MNSDPLAAKDKSMDATSAPNAASAPAKKVPSKKAPAKTSSKKDQPYFDPTPYGNGPNDAIDTSQADENAVVAHHSVNIGGANIAYTATVGHLVTVDPTSSSKLAAKMFYVAFTKDGAKEETHPLTFFYNNGRPGSSSVFMLLGSFAPRRIRTAMPSFTPPAPYQMEDNPDSLFDKSDLIFVNPVGTGYSAAIAPNTNRNFCGRGRGRGFHHAVHQALSDEEQPLEFAEVPVRRVVRHGAQLRARLQAARGRRGSERCYAAIVHSRLPAGGQSGRRAADCGGGRVVTSQETRCASDCRPIC